MTSLPKFSADSDSTPGCNLSLSSMSRTHVGLVRQINEDRILDRPDRALWAVADGMGGHRGGDLAAELAIKGLRSLADGDDAITSEAILSALEQANSQIFRHGEAAGAMIGSTIVALHIANGHAYLFWAGDSRAYLARNSEYRQVTSDHSLVQELIDAGALDQAQALRHPQSHVITRALGAEAEIGIETTSLAIQTGDVLLLCSDGLSRAVDPCTAADLDCVDSGAAAKRMLSEALRLDGSDNISFILVNVADPQQCEMH